MKLLEYKPEIKFIAWDKIENKMIYDNEVSGYLNYIFAGYTDDSGCSKIRSEILLPYTNCNDAEGNKLYLFDVCQLSISDTTLFIIIYDKDRYAFYDLKNSEKTNFFLSLNKFNARSQRIGSIYELTEIQKQFNIEV